MLPMVAAHEQESVAGMVSCPCVGSRQTSETIKAVRLLRIVLLRSVVRRKRVGVMKNIKRN